MLSQLLRSVRRPGSAGASSEPDPEQRSNNEDGGINTDLEDPNADLDELVLLFLEEQGGRMWQQDIVANVGYSAGKVSEALTEMEANRRITRYWRENGKVVAFPELGPEASIR